MTQFIEFINQQHQTALPDYFAVHAWSVAHPGEFWQAVWAFTDIIGHLSKQAIYVPGARMQDTQWFTGSRLNFAENLLRYRDEQAALVFRSELGKNQTITYSELYQQVSALADWLRRKGVAAGRPGRRQPA